MSEFKLSSFENGLVKFSAFLKPVSTQNNGGKRAAFKNELQEITKDSKFIITGTCWIAIDYYCQHVKREKNPGVYDIDNIIKPILDALVGLNGLLIDDVIVNRVTVNWIDTPCEDYFEVEIEYPDLLFTEKETLVFLKDSSGWCFPSSFQSIKNEKYIEMMKNYYSIWNGISNEDDYYNVLGNLPIQNFVYYSKIKDKGYNFFEFSTANKPN